jgi:ferric-dicitrate binding protein FerR (iron transport regulator)
MRHVIVAATMIVAALIITFGTASVLQGVATAHVNAPNEPFVIEASRPSVKPVGTKERMTSQARDRIRTEVNVSGL